MSDRVKLKHLEMENQKYQFRYLRNQLEYSDRNKHPFRKF